MVSAGLLLGAASGRPAGAAHAEPHRNEERYGYRNRRKKSHALHGCLLDCCHSMHTGRGRKAGPLGQKTDSLCAANHGDWLAQTALASTYGARPTIP